MAPRPSSMNTHTAGSGTPSGGVGDTGGVGGVGPCAQQITSPGGCEGAGGGLSPGPGTSGGGLGLGSPKSSGRPAVGNNAPAGVGGA